MKRSPLKRKTRLTPGKTPLKRLALKAKSHPTDPVSVAAIIVRSGGSCERCKSRAGSEPHHIRARSQGRDDSPENLRWLCHECHSWATNHPRAAHFEGVSYSAKWAATGDDSEQLPQG